MTTPASIKKADLNRMAEVALEKGVTVWTEINGRKFGVSPIIPEIHNAHTVDPKPEDFTSLDEWQAWRDRTRAREAQRHS